MRRSRLGVIAGSGPLPRRIAEAQHGRGGSVFVLALDGITDPATVTAFDHAWVKLGRLQAAFDCLHAAAVQDVVMAGPVTRPALSSLDIDRRAVRMLFRAGRRAFGDDGLLSSIITELENDGFNVVGIDAVIDGILAPAGPIAGSPPDAGAWSDIERGIAVLRCLAPADVGQGVAVQGGVILAVEAAEGTDAMIVRAGSLKKQGAAPVLVKMCKWHQEHRADLPALGPVTIRHLHAAGFRGVAVQACASLLFDREEVCRMGRDGRDLRLRGDRVGKTAL